MRVLVTGRAVHLGAALMRLLPIWGHVAIGLDLKLGSGAAHVGSTTDRVFVMRALQKVDGVIRTAALHKPHIVTHSEEKFIDTNITGTYTLLEAAETRWVTRFVMSSTTSAFGAVLMPSAGAPVAWIDETVTPMVKNIYGLSKVAAEDLCQLFARQTSINTVVLRLVQFLQSLIAVKLYGAMLLMPTPRPTNFSIA
jgi:UDP-glucose 4-epimerase